MEETDRGATTLPASQHNSQQLPDNSKQNAFTKEWKYLRPPNRGKYNQNLGQLQTAIAKREDDKKNQIEILRSARENLRNFRDERDTTNQRKVAVFQQLDHLNEEAKKRNDTLMKLRGGIPHSKQEDIDAQMRKLEYQIMNNNFGLPERKRISSEIDRLRRSKKNLKEYNSLKGELDVLRGKQNASREERDALFQKLREIKKKEDDARLQIKDANNQLDSIRADIEHFRNEKYSLTTKFKEQEAEFRKRQVEEQAAILAERQKELAIIEANKVPYEHEMFLCNLLISYTQTLAATGTKSDGSSGEGGVVVRGSGIPSSSHLLTLPSPAERRRSSGFSTCTVASDVSSHYATPMGCTPVGTPLEGSPPSSFDEGSPSNTKGYYKKDDHEIFFQGTKKSTKKSRSERRQQSSKKLLAHNPEIFVQFGELHMFPPIQAGDVDSVLAQLRKKLEFFRCKSEHELKSRQGAKHSQNNLDTHDIQIIVDPVVSVEDPIDNKIFDNEMTDQSNKEDSNSVQCLESDINELDKRKLCLSLNIENDNLPQDGKADNNDTPDLLDDVSARLLNGLKVYSNHDVTNNKTNHTSESVYHNQNGNNENDQTNLVKITNINPLCMEDELLHELNALNDTHEMTTNDKVSSDTLAIKTQDIHPSIV